MVWQCVEPGSGRTFMTDPVWPCEKELQTVHLRRVEPAIRAERQAAAIEPSRIWWLEMSDGGYEIVSAGPLTGGRDAAANGRSVVERMPNVTVGPSAGRRSLS